MFSHWTKIPQLIYGFEIIVKLLQFLYKLYIFTLVPNTSILAGSHAMELGLNPIRLYLTLHVYLLCPIDDYYDILLVNSVNVSVSYWSTTLTKIVLYFSPYISPSALLFLFVVSFWFLDVNRWYCCLHRWRP